MSSSLLRRLALALFVLAMLAGALWWAKRPKPIVVVVANVDQGRVESSIANTRAGTVEACQRAKLSSTLGGRIETLAVKEGDKVKMTMRFRGREMSHTQLGLAVLQRVAEMTAEVAKVEAHPRTEGRQMLMVLAPK